VCTVCFRVSKGTDECPAGASELFLFIHEVSIFFGAGAYPPVGCSELFLFIHEVSIFFGAGAYPYPFFSSSSEFLIQLVSIFLAGGYVLFELMTADWEFALFSQLVSILEILFGSSGATLIFVVLSVDEFFNQSGSFFANGLGAVGIGTEWTDLREG